MSPRQVEGAGVGAGKLGSAQTSSHKASSHNTTLCIDNPKSWQGALPLSSHGLCCRRPCSCRAGELSLFSFGLCCAPLFICPPQNTCSWLVSLLPPLRGLGKRARTFSLLCLTCRCIKNLLISCFGLLAGAGLFPAVAFFRLSATF